MTDEAAFALMSKSRVAANEKILTLPKESYAMVRIVTTPKRFFEVSNNTMVDGSPDDLVNQWVSVRLIPRGIKPGPIAQVATLRERGYTELVSYTVDDIGLFGDDPEAPRSLGAAGNADKQMCANLKKLGEKFSGRSMSAHVLFHHLSVMPRTAPETVQVHDVGQANFISVLDSGGLPLFHFDVGWPIKYLAKTAPSKVPALPIAKLVVLSHWDWDHLHGYYVWPELQKSFWLAPVQDLGPGALHIAMQLDGCGNLLSITPHGSIRPFSKLTARTRIRFASGAHCKSKSQEKNNSGLYVDLILSSGIRGLLPADADYSGLTSAKSYYDFLVVTHHGGIATGSPPRSRRKYGQAVVSVGKGNPYGHPNRQTISTCRKSGWSISFTCAKGKNARGDRAIL